MVNKEWTFDDKWSNRRDICMACGMIPSECMCDYQVQIDTDVEFWLLVHPEEFKRTSNTGRLIKEAIASTKVFQWDRVEAPRELVELLDTNAYNVYLVMAADRENEKKRLKNYESNGKKSVFLLLDGTWKEVRKMIRKSDYLANLPILAFHLDAKSKYTLRRNTDEHHLCTAEAAIALLDLANDQEAAKRLEHYFDTFMAHFDRSKLSPRIDVPSAK